MKAQRYLWSIQIVLLVASISACSPRDGNEELPVVNDENCAPEKIAAIKQKDTQEKFASLCFRRGQFKPSPRKEW